MTFFLGWPVGEGSVCMSFACHVFVLCVSVPEACLFFGVNAYKRASLEMNPTCPIFFVGVHLPCRGVNESFGTGLRLPDTLRSLSSQSNVFQWHCSVPVPRKETTERRLPSS